MGDWTDHTFKSIGNINLVKDNWVIEQGKSNYYCQSDIIHKNRNSIDFLFDYTQTNDLL